MRPNLIQVLLVLLGATLSLAHEDLAPESQLPRLFEFRHFIDHFKKRYSSQLERTTRQLYFYASAFQVYTAGLAYRSRQSGHYLALNPLSDLSPREWELMQNKQPIEGIADPDDQASQLNLPTIPSGKTPADLAREFEVEIKRQLEAAAQKHSSEKVRRKRSTSSGRERELQPRHLTMSMLIQPAEPLVEPADVRDKLERHPRRNNLNYNRLLMETKSRGLDDQQTPVELWALRAERPEAGDKPSNDPSPAGGPQESQKGDANSGSFARGLLEILTGIHKSLDDFLGHLDPDYNLDGSQQEVSAEPQSEEMFIDLRDSGCMLKPKRQGFCGSCYAFVAITMAEWLYCKSARKLVPFSEQYIVDCGNDHVEGLRGCRSGRIDLAAHFIHNFGLELADHYPYHMNQSACPYDSKTDLNKVGFIRMKLNQIVTVPVSKWPKLLANTPIAVNVAVSSDFQHYGGGVFSGETCCERPNHGMVVVGHGRQDGQEFWLLRNSYGTQWGEGGYWKLAKSAPDRCIGQQDGYAYGTRNARKFNYKTEMNELNYRAQAALHEALEPKLTDFV